MGRRIVALVLLICVVGLVGCSTHVHKVGNGPSGSMTTSQRQWYVLFGLVPINDVDSAQMAGDAEDYEIQTQASFVDLVIGAFTGMVSVNCRTVTVTK